MRQARGENKKMTLFFSVSSPLRFSSHKFAYLIAMIFQLFKVITLEKCVLTILELNWNQRLARKTPPGEISHSC